MMLYLKPIIHAHRNSVCVHFVKLHKFHFVYDMSANFWVAQCASIYCYTNPLCQVENMFVEAETYYLTLIVTIVGKMLRAFFTYFT